MTRPRYRFEIDWADDFYRHALAEIPEEHVVDYVLDWGTDIVPRSPEISLLTRSSSSLTLFAPDGRYFAPGNGLTDEELYEPHDWRLYIGDHLARRGRAVYGWPDITGLDISPVAWALEGKYENNLLSDQGYTAPAGKLQAVVRDIALNAQVPVRSDSQTPMRSFEFRGRWARLLNLLATMVGGWAIEEGNGRINLLAAVTAAAAAADYTFTSAVGIEVGPNRSGTRRMVETVRTRLRQVGGGVDDDPIPDEEEFNIGDEERYGRSVAVIPRWYEDSLAGVLAWIAPIIQLRSPDLLAELHLVDDYPTEAIAEAVVENFTSGRKISGPVPTTAGAVDHNLVVLRTRLSGGSGRLPERVVWGIDVTSPVAIGIPSFAVAADRLSATATVVSTPDNTRRYWRFRVRGADRWSRTMDYVADSPSESFKIDGLAIDTDYDFEISTSNRFPTLDTVKASFDTRAHDPIVPALPVAFPICFIDGPLVVTDNQPASFEGSLLVYAPSFNVATLYSGRWRFDFVDNRGRSSGLKRIQYGFPTQPNEPASRPIPDDLITAGANRLRITLGHGGSEWVATEGFAVSNLSLASARVSAFGMDYYDLQENGRPITPAFVPATYPLNATGARTIQVCWDQVE